MKKVFIKTLMMTLIFVMLLNINLKTIYAAIEINLDKAFIEKIGQADYHLKYYRDRTDSYMYLICSIVGYYDKNKNFNPTYCMNKDLIGAESESYYVKTESLLRNDKVWRIIKNGYPYKTAKELGLENNYDAYAVTKFAIYCILGESNIEYFKAEEDDKEAVAMLKVLKNLVNIGLNGSEKQNDDPLVIQRQGEFKEEGDFYSQEYKVISKSDFLEYEIINSENLPYGVYFSDLSGNVSTKFKNGDNFKIMIPAVNLLEDFEIPIEVKAECKAYVILEGKTTVTNTQNYVVTAGEYATANASEKLIYQVEKGNAKIIKVDSENNSVKIAGVKFDVFDENNNFLEQIETDENGEALTSYYKLIQYKNIYLKEKETNSKYILNDNLIEINLEASKTKEVIITNEKIKGKIQVLKTSADDNEITGKKAGAPLEDVEFEIYDSENNFIEKIKTNTAGIAITSDLLKGKYIVKEYKTLEYYNLDLKSYPVEIKDNGEIIQLKLINESQKPSVEIEKTGTERAEVGSEIEYDIRFKNNGNTDLENVVIEDIIPSDYIIIKKLKTGTYNQEKKYNLYYKTNFTNNNYVLMMEDLNSRENYEIDFSGELADNEYIIALKLEFPEVDDGFCSNENIYINAKIRENVKSEIEFCNNVSINAMCNKYKVKDNSKWKTVAYKLLPVTGK